MLITPLSIFPCSLLQGKKGVDETPVDYVQVETGPTKGVQITEEVADDVPDTSLACMASTSGAEESAEQARVVETETSKWAFVRNPTVELKVMKFWPAVMVMLPLVAMICGTVLGNEDLVYQIFHAVCASMLAIIVLGGIDRGLSKKGKSVFIAVNVGFAHVIRGCGTSRRRSSFSAKAYRSKLGLDKPSWSQDDMDTNKLASLLTSAYLEPADVDLDKCAVSMADVGLNMSTYAVQDVVPFIDVVDPGAFGYAAGTVSTVVATATTCVLGSLTQPPPGLRFNPRVRPKWPVAVGIFASTVGVAKAQGRGFAETCVCE